MRPVLRLLAFTTLLPCVDAVAQDAPAPADPSPWTFDGAVQVVPEGNMFWGLDEVFAPGSGYDDDSTWLEAYARVGWRDERPLGGATLYGGVSVLATGTVGTDVFDQRNQSDLALEEAYIGVKGGEAVRWDSSVGSRAFALNHGMLVSLGGGNGFERGALALAPHKAWELAGVVEVQAKHWSVTAFHLDPDELASSDTHTRIIGARVGVMPSPATTLGVSYLYVPRSEAIYPVAPVGIIPNARDGLRTWDVDLTWAPTEGALAGLSVRGEFAVQRNPAIDLRARGAVLDVAYQFRDTRWTPKLSYSPRWFDGDKPGTATLERFDPLFYDGSPATWSSGGNGSFAFYNANLWVQRLRVDLVLSPRDFANIGYYDVRAARANSPVQYGQAARLEFQDGQPVVVSGFPDRRLTHEWYLEHTRVLTPHWFLTWGIAIAKPRQGLRAVVPDARTWYGGLVNIAWTF